MAPAVTYSVRLIDPAAHLLEVELRVSAPDPSGQVFNLPAWIPGSYMIRDFARNVIRVSGCTEGRRISIEKLDKHTWRADACEGPLTLNYEVYAWDLSVRGAHFDSTHAYFNGAVIFLRVEGEDGKGCELELLRPEVECGYSWSVATTLEPVQVDGYGFGRYAAENYAYLIDRPVEIGPLARAEFEVLGVPHQIAVYGRQRSDLDRLGRDLAGICEQHARLFGVLPLSRYLFLVMAVGEGYGGLEHSDCTSLICSRNDLPRPGVSEVSAEYRRFLGLCSHEYFHLWNVKRIRPANLAVSGLREEAYTRLLWFFEGVTSYYDDLALVRSGCIDERAYLELLAGTVTRVMRGSGRLKQSVSDSSFDAWIKFYKQDENSPNAIVSYYAKGALVALALDLTLRERTAGDRSLDEVMRELWRRYGATDIGVPEDGIERVAAEVARMDLGEFFDLAVRGTEDPPLAELLRPMGIEMRLRPALDSKEMGGVVSDSSEVPQRRGLGVRLQDASVEAVISQVYDGGAARVCGLSAGDVIVAVDGLRASAGNLDRLINALPEGKAVRIHAFRRDELMEVDVCPLPLPEDTCEFQFLADPDGDFRRRREGWLGPV